MRAIAALVVLAGCDLVFAPSGVRPDAGPPGSDAPSGPDAPDVPSGPDARPDGVFALPIRLMLGQTLPFYATDPTLTADQQRLTFVVRTTEDTDTSVWAADNGGSPISWVNGIQEPFGTNRPQSPELAPDGLLIAVIIDLGGGNHDIRTRRRPDLATAWNLATDFDPINSGVDDRVSTPTADLLHVIRCRRTHPGPANLVELERPSTSDAWMQTPGNPLASIDLEQPLWHKHSPHLTPDGLILVYAAAPDVNQPSDLYITFRSTLGEPFDTPVPITELNDPQLYEGDPWLSPDRRRLYFSRAHVNSVREDEWGIYYTDRTLP